MQIFEFQDTEEQILLCLNYDFSSDCEANREVAFKQLGPARDAKRFWAYNTLYTGLRILVAYEGTSPVGQLEYLPIEHAPRPVTGEGLTFINCINVAPGARGRRVGSGLLRECETKAREYTDGLAVIAQPDSPFMPARFFTAHDFQPVASEDGDWLMVKTWDDVPLPAFLPRAYAPVVPTEAGKAVVDCFWCNQCPFNALTHERLKKVAQELGEAVTVREVNTDDRVTLEKWGIANGLFIDGQPLASRFPGEKEIRRKLESVLAVGM